MPDLMITVVGHQHGYSCDEDGFECDDKEDDQVHVRKYILRAKLSAGYSK